MLCFRCVFFLIWVVLSPYRQLASSLCISLPSERSLSWGTKLDQKIYKPKKRIETVTVTLQTYSRCEIEIRALVRDARCAMFDPSRLFDFMNGLAGTGSDDAFESRSPWFELKFTLFTLKLKMPRCGSWSCVGKWVPGGSRLGVGRDLGHLPSLLESLHLRLIYHVSEF